MKNSGASEKHINNNLKAIMNFGSYIDSSKTFFDIFQQTALFHLKFLAAA
jgi:hypothetical protein